MTKPKISVAVAIADSASPGRYPDLQPDEVQRADAFKAPSRREQYLLARALLRALLEEHTGRPAASFVIGADDRGKPFCTDGPAISIAHSRDVVACVVADHGDVGIDIEFPGQRRNIAGIAARFFTATEARWLAAQPEDRFYMLWVLKEAWLKAKGTGIAGGLDSLQCTIEPPHIEAKADDDSLRGLSLFQYDDGFLAIATTALDTAALVLRRWQRADGSLVPASDIPRIADYCSPR